MMKYYINGVLVKTVNLSESCAWGYPSGVSGNDGIFSFLSSSDIKLYYGASFSVYPTMAGTAEAYLDKAEYFTYAKSTAEITGGVDYTYLNTFSGSLGGTAVTGHPDNGVYVHLDETDNNGRTGTAYFPYTQNGGNDTNYVSTGISPFDGLNTSNGLSVSFWHRINGNYWGNLEALTFAQGEMGECKYFTIGSDGYIRFNNGNGGSDPNLSGAGLYFDYTQAESAIHNKEWQFITLDIIDDFHFKLYINGVHIKDITVSGTNEYNNAGGLMSYLTSGSTKLYLGSYTPYWGTCTLSLDNIYCFDRALTNSEAYSLYMSEINGSQAELTQDFSQITNIHSGQCQVISEYEGKSGVLYIPSESENGDYTVTVDGDTVSDTSAVFGQSSVTVTYTGNKTVTQWLLVRHGTDEILDTAESSQSYTFTLTENAYVYCVLENAIAEEADLSAYLAAVELAGEFDENDYSPTSYQNLTDILALYDRLENASPTQAEADAATFDILSAISSLVPYLYLNVNANGGTVSVSVNNETHGAGRYSLLFGDEITLTATPDSGNTFIGWYETKTKRIFSTSATFTFKLTSNTNYEARFTNGETATLTFKNYSGQLQSEITKTIAEWNDISSLDSLLPNVPYRFGYTNGVWADTASALALLKAGTSAEVYPEYQQGSATYPALPVPDSDIPVSTLNYYYDSNQSVASFVMALGVPSGCNIESVGIALYYKKAAVFDPTQFTVNITNKMTTSKFEVSQTSDYYTLNVSGFTSNNNWAVRGYATYYDSNGSLKIAYSNQINVIDKVSV